MTWMTLFAMVWLWQAPAAQPETPSSQPFESTRWRLVSVGDTVIPGDGGSREAYVVFYPGGSVKGSDGCNGFNTSYTVDGDTLTLKGILGTLMACNLPDQYDRRFREALMATRGWRATAEELTLLDEDGNPLAQLVSP